MFLGYYHQKRFSAAWRWIIWCNVSNGVKWLRRRQLWIQISFTFFIHIIILNFSPFFPHFSSSSFDRPIACLCSFLFFLSSYIFKERITPHCHWALAKNSFLEGQMFQNVIFDRNHPAGLFFDLPHTLEARQPCSTQSTNYPCRNQYWIKTLPLLVNNNTKNE